jgi:hypothetical protein
MLLLIFPLLAYLHTSFGLLGTTQIAWHNLTLLSPRLSHAGQPDRQNWLHREILEELRLHSRVPGKKTVMVGSDTPHFNANNFELAALEGSYPFRVTTSAYETDLPALANAANSAAFFIFKEGGEQGPSFTNRLFGSLLKEVHTSRKFVEVSAGRARPPLVQPDGGKVFIYRNTWPNSPIYEGYFVRPTIKSLNPFPDDIPPCEVEFGDLLALAGLSFEIEGKWLRVSYRWRCFRPPQHELMCFTHVLDRHEKVLGFLDHEILAGFPKLTSWQENDVATEKLCFRLPDEVNAVRLRLGLFDPSSGMRLQVQRANAPERVRFSLVDRGTSVLVQQEDESETASRRSSSGLSTITHFSRVEPSFGNCLSDRNETVSIQIAAGCPHWESIISRFSAAERVNSQAVGRRIKILSSQAARDLRHHEQSLFRPSGGKCDRHPEILFIERRQGAGRQYPCLKEIAIPE